MWEIQKQSEKLCEPEKKKDMTAFEKEGITLGMVVEVVRDDFLVQEENLV